jgi:hypothetical protein
MAICRVYNKVGHALLTVIPVVLLELGGAALGAHLAGLVGLSIGWVASVYIESIFMFRTVYKVIWSIQTSHLTTKTDACTHILHPVKVL